MPYFFLILFFFSILVSSILRSENTKLKYFTFSENKLPKSRLLIDRQIENKEIKVKKKKNSENKSKLEKKKKEKIKTIKEIDLQKRYEFRINFSPEEEKPSAEEIKIFYDNLVKLNKKAGITIKAYAQKRENDSTSKVRRLSLKRALFLRSLFLRENYNISQIYIKALGHDNELKGNKDIVIITNN